MTTHAVRPIVAGEVSGPAFVLSEPLSLWGGLDAETGLIIDQHHPQRGDCISDTVLVMPFGRGSSSASSVLAEAIRLGTAPRAFVLLEPDEILTLGVLVGQELYGTITPIYVVDEATYQAITAGTRLTLSHGSLSF